MAAVFEHPQHSSNIGNTSNMSNKHEQHHQQSGKCHLPMHLTLDGIVAALLFGLTDTFVTHYCRRFMCDVFISSVVSLKLFSYVTVPWKPSVYLRFFRWEGLIKMPYQHLSSRCDLMMLYFIRRCSFYLFFNTGLSSFCCCLKGKLMG